MSCTSWKSITKKYSWFEKCYIRQPNFRVKCRVENCGKELIYAEIRAFTKHMRNIHKDVSLFEEQKCKIDENWIYFMLTKEQEVYIIECILCHKIVDDEFSTKDHIFESHTFHDRIGYQKHNKFWAWKYQIEVGDFFVKCKLCLASDIKMLFDSSRLKHHYLEKHEDIWKKMEREEVHHNQVLLCNSNMSWKSVIEMHSWLEKCYIHQPNFRVKCRAETCTWELEYANISEFSKHMRNTHEDVFSFEEQKYQRDGNWTYFMLMKQQEMYFIVCLLCHKIVDDEFSIKDHIQNHLVNYFLVRQKLYHDFRRYYNEHWLWKYQMQDGDFSVKCKLCVASPFINIKLIFWSTNLESHYMIAHADKWKEIEENVLQQRKTHAQTGTSINHAN